MFLIVNQYTTIIQRYGLRNIVRKIWLGGIAFALIHAAVFWHVQWKIGAWGDKIEAANRAFATHGMLWKPAAAVLGFPLSFVDTSGFAYFGLMVLNSILWGVAISFLTVPAFVKK